MDLTFTTVLKYGVIAFIPYIAYNYYQNIQGKVYFNKNSLLSQYLVANSNLINPKFYPTFGLDSSFLQTVVSTFLPLRKDLQFKEEIVPQQNTDKIGIKLNWPSFKNSDKKIDKNVIVFVLPGLTGEPTSSYINNLTGDILDQGYQPIIYNYRVFSQQLQINSAKKIDLVEDVKFTLDYIQSQNPNSVIYAIGHSYGANQILNYLGRYPEQQVIKGAVNLGNPYHMDISVKHMQNTIYDFLIARVLVNGLKKMQSKYQKAQDEGYFQFDIEKAFKATNARQFDDNLTRHLYGFDTVDHYYEGFGCPKVMKNIKVPVLGINSMDDGVSHKNAVPYEIYEQSENMVLYMTPRGGHIGWVSGPFWNMKAWFFKPSLDFINAIQNMNKNK